MNKWKDLLKQLQQGDIKALARSISLVENEQPGYENLLQLLPPNQQTKIIGFTGPPGAGKSTLVDSLIGLLVNSGKRVAVICVDPSSPFNFGALLGDRIRMSEWYTHPKVFIRSVASRGSMGGLNPKIIELTDLLKAGGYDQIIVETVGVGQSEIEIAGLADTTVVVLVPESGDEVQTMKAGLMEIADIFVVNKSDRPAADVFVKNLRLMLAPAFSSHTEEVPVMKTIASQKEGVQELFEKILHLQSVATNPERKLWLLTERAWELIQHKRMDGLSKSALKEKITDASRKNDFNLYDFIKHI
jgi:GTPase